MHLYIYVCMYIFSNDYMSFAFSCFEGSSVSADQMPVRVGGLRVSQGLIAHREGIGAPRCLRATSRGSLNRAQLRVPLRAPSGFL